MSIVYIYVLGMLHEYLTSSEVVEQTTAIRWSRISDLLYLTQSLTMASAIIRWGLDRTISTTTS